MDYIPSNKHGDYISHSEDYLMHYGVKGMKWKDHDYVNAITTGAKAYANVKSKIKQLKKFVGKVGAKAKSIGIEVVDPRIREHDYVKNHKVHEEQDKREADMKLAQAITKAKLHTNMSDKEIIDNTSVAARAGILRARATNSENYPASWRTRQKNYRHMKYINKKYINEKRDETANEIRKKKEELLKKRK